MVSYGILDRRIATLVLVHTSYDGSVDIMCGCALQHSEIYRGIKLLTHRLCRS